MNNPRLSYDKPCLQDWIKKKHDDVRKHLSAIRRILFPVITFVVIYFVVIAVLNVIYGKPALLYFQRPIELPTFIMFTIAILVASIRGYRKKYSRQGQGH